MSEMMWKSYIRNGSQGSGSSLVLLFLMTFLQHLEDSGVMGEVMCYQCVWQSSGPLPSTEKVNDVCRPQNFNPATVHQDMCPQGCIISILYEYDPEMPTTTTVKPSLRKNGTSSDPTKPPMTFFFRGCPKDDRPRSKTGCEEKSHQNVHHEECFCTTNLCNGNSGSRKSLESFWFYILILLSPALSSGLYNLSEQQHNNYFLSANA